MARTTPTRDRLHWPAAETTGKLLHPIFSAGYSPQACCIGRNRSSYQHSFTDIFTDISPPPSLRFATVCLIITMDINRHNFWASFPVVLDALATAEYVSLDLEMTGVFLETSQHRNGHPSTNWTKEDVYQRSKAIAEHFNIVQFGLTCLKYSIQQKGKSYQDR
jgi:hypothetical protein